MSDREGSSLRLTKRYRVFRELLETEENYVEILKTVINSFQIPLEDAKLTDVESRVQRRIFGHFEPLLRIHSYILSSLQQLDNQWTNNSLVGQIYASQKQELLDIYVSYINNYQQITEKINEMAVADSEFDEFIQNCEVNGHQKRYKLSDLMIRPIQRLPSAMLLHSELIKTTEKKSPNSLDLSWLRAAHETIQHVLSVSNQKRMESEQYDNTMHWINQIERFPSVLVSQRRLLQEKADFHVVKANGMFSHHKGYDVTFFLFKDCITVAKKRRCNSDSPYGTPERHNSTLSVSSSHSHKSTLKRHLSMNGTFQRNTSFFNVVKAGGRKPFAHLELLRFPDFRSLMFLEEEGLFFVKVRDKEAEEINAFQIAGDTTTDNASNFFTKLCGFINKSNGRDLKLEEVTNELQSESISHEDRIFIWKARHVSAKVKDGALCPPSSLRRAVSSSLRRLHSKSHALNTSFTTPQYD
ncbi:Protein ECT2 [Aphelenchoides besseyi]|nr:Protein ECT2 [Aphelenchoides besseyi]